MPLKTERYAEMFGERLDEYGTQVYLVNTGWSGGAFGTGSRIKLAYTRAMVTAALNGDLENAEYVHDDRFNLEIPVSVKGVPEEIMIPKNTWADAEAYDRQADELAEMFITNFEKKYPDMPAEISEAGPARK
jgi:phosphoenolpyruvate carboxykinase (ATP)